MWSTLPALFRTDSMMLRRCLIVLLACVTLPGLTMEAPARNSFAGFGAIDFTLERASSTIKPHIVACKAPESCDNTLTEPVSITTEVVEVYGAKLVPMMNNWGLGGRSETAFSKPVDHPRGVFYVTGSQFNDVELTPNNLRGKLSIVMTDSSYLPADRESFHTYWLVTNTPVLAGFIFTGPDDERSEVSIPKGTCVNIKAESTRMASLFRYCNRKSELIEIQHFKEIEDSVLKAGITPELLGFKE